MSKVATYNPDCGTHIDMACAEAVRLAVRQHCTVRLVFNGIELEANPASRASALAESYHSEMDRRAELHRQSPEGIAAVARRAGEVVRKQAECDSLLSELPRILQSNVLDDLMRWLKSFAAVADDVDVKFNKPNLVRLLGDAGFRRNELCGNPPHWFKTKNRMGRYIVGQVIDCLLRDLPPHPVTMSFVDKYFTKADAEPAA